MNEAGDGTYSKILSLAAPQLGQTGWLELTAVSLCSSLSVFEINIINYINIIYIPFYYTILIEIFLIVLITTPTKA